MEIYDPTDDSLIGEFGLTAGGWDNWRTKRWERCFMVVREPTPEPTFLFPDTLAQESVLRMLEEFALKTEPLARLATIVRGADTARLELAPQAAGLLAASLGYSRIYRDDLEQLEAAMGFYDAMYRWCRDATEETHNWPTHKVGA